ncbi:hypothetical protein [Rhodoplanes sp. Z2-YC6860]|uniref:hypothetical protein n=1 Tax=Rhodoplanes sp. Z2-YC6860 TaxID=674703 RepID=UPI00083399DB|nr:hypothetical protein [Rhodoplanes sp. Z2-YC6860]
MSSTEPYPEVNLDESGHESRPTPQQGPEWPKKIRTLTATELDRLTIDGAGRFYWDGKLVNYEPPVAAKPASEKPEPLSRLGDLDRDPYGFDEPKPSEHTEADHIDRSDDAPMHAVAHRDHYNEFDELRTVQHRAVNHDIGTEMSETYVAPTIQMPDRIRVSMTGWQSLGALIVVLCLIVGSLGIAALGFIAAHDWGCRAGLFQSNCPAATGGRPAGRTDIPA